MRILVCGASGFVGRHLCAALTQAGHEVLEGVRHPSRVGQVAMDFERDTEVATWLPRLAGVNAVVNAVGILVESPGKHFDNIHRCTPLALFAACRQAGVQRVVQISALGADQGSTPYFVSKRGADEGLEQLGQLDQQGEGQDEPPFAWHIVRPALIYGEDGDSASFFRLLASLPLVAVPDGGRQMLQPVHIDDVAALVCRLLEPATPAAQVVEAVGSQVLSYRQMLASYRRAMGWPVALILSIPSPVITLSARLAGLVPGSILTPDTWHMLQHGNTGNGASMAALLGRQPLGLDQFIIPVAAPALRGTALASWRAPLLRGVLALVWLITAWLSLCVYPWSESQALLARVGIPSGLQTPALVGAALLDGLLGLACLLRPSRGLWLGQGALILGYTLAIAWALPEYLIHPFGPALKNLPILALLFLLWADEGVTNNWQTRKSS
jgi:uncharacterized protein YbjT (DUF2867 family)